MSTLCDGLLVAGWWLLVAGSCLVYLVSLAWLGQVLGFVIGSCLVYVLDQEILHALGSGLVNSA